MPLGSINQFVTDTYVQNETFTSDQYITGSNIYAGREGTGYPPYGDVVVDNGAHVIFDAEQDIILESGFEVKAGSTFTAGINR